MKKFKRYDRLIIEDGYRGSSGKFLRCKFKNIPVEDFPNKVSMSRHRQHGWDAKEHGDRLNPLVRYLDKQVGRPWDNVYSEIKAIHSHKHLAQSHLLDHLEYLVEKHVIYIDGFPHSIHFYGGYCSLSKGTIFVCPNTGLLKIVKKSLPHDYGEPYKPDAYKDKLRSGVFYLREEVENKKGKEKEKQNIWFSITINHKKMKTMNAVKVDRVRDLEEKMLYLSLSEREELTYLKSELKAHKDHYCGEIDLFSITSTELRKQLNSKELKWLRGEITKIKNGEWSEIEVQNRLILYMGSLY